MTRAEVNKEIHRVIGQVVPKMRRKADYRAREARKADYPDHRSVYKEDGVEFWVFYHYLHSEDLIPLFCKYYDQQGVVYAYILPTGLGRELNIGHFLKHALDRYNYRLDLGFSDLEDVMRHLVKNDMTMVDKRTPSDEEGYSDAAWRSKNVIWLGRHHEESGVHEIRTFVNNKLIFDCQKHEITDEIMEEFAKIDQELGKDA